MEPLKNRWIEIQGYKHDGRMHRIWDSVYVVDENEEYIVVASTKTKVIEHDFRIWYTKEPAIMIFFKDRWWNVIAMLKKIGITYYVNLASPFVCDCQKVKYIDYDLDLKVFPDGNYKVLDRNEYRYHRRIMKYSEELDFILKKEMENVILMKENNIGPFDKKVNDYYYEKYLSLNV